MRINWFPKYEKVEDKRPYTKKRECPDCHREIEYWYTSGMSLSFPLILNAPFPDNLADIVKAIRVSNKNKLIIIKCFNFISFYPLFS